jgi:hypothetical protein
MLKEYARQAQGRYAYSVYFQKKKLGWVIEDKKLGKHNGKDVLIQTGEYCFTTLRDGQKSVKRHRSVTYYALEGGALVYSETRSSQDKKETLRRVVRKGNGMLVTTTEGGRTTERRVAHPKANLADARRFEAWLAQAKKGETFVRWTTSWDQAPPDVKETCTFGEKKTVVRAGKKVSVYAVAVATPEMRIDTELFGNGALFRGSVENGMLTFVLDEEAQARKDDGGEIDLLRDFSISIDGYLGKQGYDLEKLTLEVTGLEQVKLPQSHRQSWRPGKDRTVIVELQQDFRAAKEAPLSDTERTEYTKATPRMQSDHKAIREQMQKIVGKEQEPLKVATLLSQWVHRKMRKTYAEDPENAVSALDNLAGDCKAHTLLFVALARAAGLPAREVVGLGYCLMGGKGVFGWHAWAEVHDGKQWVSIDPTWNQVYVDATHLKVADRDNADLVKVLGKVKIKVLREELVVRMAKAG